MTVAMAAFCFVSSMHRDGAVGGAAFLAIGVTDRFVLRIAVGSHGVPVWAVLLHAVFGPGVFGVPYIIPLAWYVIVYLSFIIANLMVEHRPIVHGSVAQAVWLSLIGAAVVTAYDLSLDPFMVTRVRAWVMENPGTYFGEQYRGFAGWMLTSFLISVTFRLTQRQGQPTPATIPRLPPPIRLRRMGCGACFSRSPGNRRRREPLRCSRWGYRC